MRGFSLIEIMVALMIGMFGVMVMMQVLSLSEGQKRTTTGSNDSMNEGVMALYALQTDLRMGGYGIADLKLLGCTLKLNANVTLAQLAPVTINSPNIPAGDPFTDTLLVFYSNGFGTTQGDLVTAVGNAVRTPASFAPGDLVLEALGVQPAPCVLVAPALTGIDVVNTITVIPSNVTLTSGRALTVNSTLFNLGPSYRAVGYAVRGGNLTMCDFANAATNCGLAASYVSIANNIVSLRAQYGRDTLTTVAGVTLGNMDGVVDVFDQVTPPASTACSWARISAVRLAVVARSNLLEKVDPLTNLPVTQNAPTWAGSVAVPVNSAVNAINLTNDPNWQNYRYKIFQTVVPIRNVSWMRKASSITAAGVQVQC